MNENVEIVVKAAAATIKLELIAEPNLNNSHITNETDELQQPIQIEPQEEIKIDPTPIEEQLLSYCEDITDPLATFTTNHSKKVPKHRYVSPTPHVKFKCSQCFGQFQTRFERDEHKKIHKQQQQKPIVTAGTYKCSLCTLEFPSFQLRNEHKKNDHNFLPSDNNPKFECQPCKTFFKNEDRLRFHTLHFHPPKQQEINVIKPETTEEYNCIQEHSPLQPEKSLETVPVITAAYSLRIEHKCTKCAQTFSTLNKVLIHEKHHGEKWACRICPAGFNTKHYLLNHRRLAHPDLEKYILLDVPTIPPDSIYCQECNLTFTRHFKTLHDRDVHNIVRGPDYKFKCSICSIGFQNKAKLIRHENDHQSPFIVHCPLCPKIFKTSRGMQSHKHALHGYPHSNKNSCSKCDEVFSTINKLTVHEKTHGDKWPCDLCPAGFKQIATVLKHRKKFHRDAITKYDFQPPASTYKCLKCNPIQEFITSTELYLHTKKDHRDTFKFKCTKCDEKFQSFFQKMKHEKSHPISCPQCPLFFYGDQALINHRARSHPIKVKCSKCDEIFPSENQRDRHETIHGDDWPCLLCPVGFRTKHSALTHRNKFHPEAEEYTYEKSNGTNSTSNTLKDAPRKPKSILLPCRLRSRKKPLIYKCTKCPAAYQGKLRLRNHEKTHGKDWICELCSVGFKSQMGLLCHWKTEHPKAKKYRWKKEKPEETLPQNYDVVRKVGFRCSKCGVTFGTAYHKKLHKCKGVQSEMVPCGLCPAVFATVVGVNEHRRMIHDDLRTSTSQVPDTEETLEDPLSFVAVSMEDVKPDVIFETSNQDGDLGGRLNPDKVFVKPELEDLICFKSETE